MRGATTVAKELGEAFDWQSNLCTLDHYGESGPTTPPLLQPSQQLVAL